MITLFDKLYEQVLVETIGVPRHVFQKLTDYIVEMYKKAQIEGISRITTETFPPKIFNIDFTGTNFAHLNIIKPRIELLFSNSENPFFFWIDPTKKSSDTIKDGKGYIHINLGVHLSSTLIHVIEHEFLHFIQYATVTWKIKTGKISDMPTNKFEKYLGMMPNSDFLPTNTTTSGYKISSASDKKKYLVYSISRGIPIGVVVGVQKKPIYLAKDENEAIKIAILKNPNIAKLTDLTAKEVKNIKKKRIEHSARPIEYYTDLLSMTRLLQFCYYSDYKLKISKEKFFNLFIKLDPNNTQISYGIKRACDILNEFKKTLKKKKGSSAKPLYHLVIKQLYKIFVNMNYNKDYEEIRDLLTKTTREIENAKDQKYKLEYEEKMAKLNKETVELGMSKSYLSGKPIK